MEGIKPEDFSTKNTDPLSRMGNLSRESAPDKPMLYVPRDLKYLWSDQIKQRTPEEHATLDGDRLGAVDRKRDRMMKQESTTQTQEGERLNYLT